MQEKVRKMADESDVIGEIEAFLAQWPGMDCPMRDCFKLFFHELRGMAGVTLSFSARPGVSYSLRPQHDKLVDRAFFAMIDVIDDDPEDRWLSVCFYGDMITDPQERGELIPGGLAGDDGYCFDLNTEVGELADYVVARLREAKAAAAGC